MSNNDPKKGKVIVDIEKHDMLNNLDRKLAIIAALPLFLFGLIIASITIFLSAVGSPSPSQLLNIARASIWHNSAIIVGAISLLLLVYAAILAYKNRLASWSYTWLGAILTGHILSLYLVGEDRAFMISKVVDITVLALSLLSCLIIFFYVVLKGWRHSGLISMGFCGTFGLLLLFFQVFKPILSYLCLASVFVGLMDAILVYIFLRSHSNNVRIILIIILACVNIGISWTTEAVSRFYNPSRDIKEFWNLAAFLTGFLLIGTLIGIPGQFIRRKFGLLKNF